MDIRILKYLDTALSRDSSECFKKPIITTTSSQYPNVSPSCFIESETIFNKIRVKQN